MTLIEDPVLPVADADAGAAADAGADGLEPAGAVTPSTRPDAEGQAEQEAAAPVVSPALAAAASLLSSAAAAGLMAGVFSGVTARLVGVGAAALGAGMFYAASRTSRPMVVQLAAIPAAVVAGAVLVAPDATGGTANLPHLVVEALRTGGLSSPPIPFDPGWRFLLVLLVSSLAMAAASLAHGTGKPRLAALLPAPVAAAAVLVQPPGRELLSVGVALVLVIGALAVAFGADLAGQGATGQSFEVRRFGRAGASLAGLLVVLFAVSQLGFLFPHADETQVVPPKRPQPPPSSPDRVLFTVKADVAVPWRLGVLDVYEDNAWLTPPFDPRRFKPVDSTGRVPLATRPAADAPTIKATFEIADVEGRSVPDMASPFQVDNAPGGLEVDPRTGTFRVGTRARKGTRYTVQSPAPPSSKDLLRAPTPNAAMREFLKVPRPPEAVQRLLDEIPPNTPTYERLQFVRTHFYDKVVAAGAGNPVDVPPARVADMLEGKDASPYEITAGEALLARWAGVPSRIGYGYFGGEPKGDHIEIRPRHGAMWLEVWFEGVGWTPIVGRPPRAKSSLKPDPKQDDPTIRPTEELAAVVYVPIRLSRITLLYRLVQFWAVRLVPLGALAALALFLYPALVKAARSARRRRWAHRAGPRARIAAAYAELRDAAVDLNVGHPTLTPIEFVDVTVEDEEHRQLGWLVTRALWGDLARDVREDDAERAEQWSRSVRRRLLGAQQFVPRLLAAASRASLVAPYDEEIPNLWWRTSYRAKAARVVRRSLRIVVHGVRRVRPRRSVGAHAAVLLLVLAVLSLGGCARDVDLRAAAPGAPRPTDMPTVPGSLDGFRLEIEPRGGKAFDDLANVSLISRGELYTIKGGDGLVAGTLQVAAFKPGLRGRDREVRDGVLQSVGHGRLRLQRLGNERVYILRLPEQRLLLSFNPDGRSYQLLVASRTLTEPEQLFVDLLAGQRGEQAVSLAASGGTPPIDPRRGGP
jgi:hypothetical protein